jgi:predicted secreted protein
MKIRIISLFPILVFKLKENSSQKKKNLISNAFKYTPLNMYCLAVMINRTSVFDVIEYLFYVLTFICVYVRCD